MTMKKILIGLAVLLVYTSAFSAKQTVLSTDTGAQTRSKLNANFTELYIADGLKADISCFADASAFNSCFDLDWPTGFDVTGDYTVTGSWDFSGATVTGIGVSGDDLGGATALDVAALFSGSGDYLKADGSTGTPSGGAVDSVNGKTGVVVLDADDIDDTGTTNKFVTESDITNLGNLSGINTGDQDLSGYLTSATAASTYQPLMGADDNYVTDAEKAILGNTSGINTGDQDLSGYLSKTNTTEYIPTTDYHPATKKYVDDAVTAGGGYTDEAAQDAWGGLLSGGTQTGITVTYDDDNGRANFVVATQFDGTQNTTGTAAGLASQYIDWSASSGGASIANKPTIPTALSDLADDATHRVVTDAEKSTWNGKEGSLGNPSTNGYVLSSTTDGVRSWIEMTGGGTGIAHATADGNYYASKDGGWVSLTGLYAPALGADDNYVTDAEKAKIAGIAEGAEVNVNADWNSSSGDSQILNKPTIVTTVGAAGTDTNIPSEQAVRESLNLKADIENIAFLAGALTDLKIKTTAQPTNGEPLIDDTVTYGATDDNLRLWSIDKIGSELAGKAASDHTHTGVYEPYDTTILKDADIGSTVQAYDANMITWPSAISATEIGYLDGLTDTILNLLAGKQNADADLDDDAIEFVIDGGGAAITTGTKGFLEVPYNATINRATIVCDQSGSIAIDVWKDSYANYPPTDADSITASAVPTVSTATKAQDTTLTGWTTSLSAGDFIGFNVDSASTVTRCTISLKVAK